MSGLDCEQIRARLDALIDGELDAQHGAELERHLALCPACAASRRALTTLSHQIRAEATRYEAPQALRQNVARMLGPTVVRAAVTVKPERERRWPWRAASGGFGAGLALAAAVAFIIGPLGLTDPSLDAVVAAHVRALQPGHLIDVESTDQHTVKPWFDGRIDFVPPVKDLSEQGIALIGGRLDYFAGRPAAALVYRKRLHVIELFMALGTRPMLPASAAPNGYNVVHWSDQGLDYWAVSDINKSELDEFAQHWRSQ
jgi:anti-sigma factor RsiW